MSGRYGVNGWEPDLATVFNARHGDGFARQLFREEVEQAHRRRLSDEDWPDSPHAEGCFFCGSFKHPTDRH